MVLLGVLIATIPPELDGANLTENAAKLVIKDRSTLTTGYLAAYLRIVAQGEIAKHTKATSQPKLALYRIEEIPIVLPSLATQKRFADVQTQVEALLTRLNEAARPTAKVVGALTQRAFRGEL